MQIALTDVSQRAVGSVQNSGGGALGNNVTNRKTARGLGADRSERASWRRRRASRERGASTLNVLVGIVVIAIVAAVVVVVAVRNNDDTKTTGNTATGIGTGTIAPGASTTRPIVRGGTMVSSTTSTAGALNPATTSNGGVHTNAEAMFNGLLAFDTNDTVVPDLAAQLPTVTDNSDGTQDALFILKSGMKWHNDTKLVNHQYSLVLMEK